MWISCSGLAGRAGKCEGCIFTLASCLQATASEQIITAQIYMSLTAFCDAHIGVGLRDHILTNPSLTPHFCDR